MRLFNFYKGKLTYTIAGLTIAWAIVGLILGYIEKSTAMELILASLVVFGIRRAIN